ncbi:MAG: hypothetical protein ACXABY_15030 [Candidatus Thorarchaeota archaeon]|jgi:hypothetical protein
MSSENPLEAWKFLVGKWKGQSKDQFGGEGSIETTTVFTLEIRGKYIMSRNESRKDGKLENQSIGMLFYDIRNKRFLRKSFFSYGFVNNEVEYHSTENEIKFEVVSEPTPQAFDKMRWRSYIRKVSEDEIREGLEAAKEGEDFVSYGEDVMKRVK